MEDAQTNALHDFVHKCVSLHSVPSQVRTIIKHYPPDEDVCELAADDKTDLVRRSLSMTPVGFWSPLR